MLGGLPCALFLARSSFGRGRGCSCKAIALGLLTCGFCARGFLCAALCERFLGESALLGRELIGGALLLERELRQSLRLCSSGRGGLLILRDARALGSRGGLGGLRGGAIAIGLCLRARGCSCGGFLRQAVALGFCSRASFLGDARGLGACKRIARELLGAVIGRDRRRRVLR